jgi:hypothetical protein
VPNREFAEPPFGISGVREIHKEEPCFNEPGLATLHELGSGVKRLIVCGVIFALLGPAYATVETLSAIEFGAKSDGHGSVLLDGLDPRNTPSAVAIAGNEDIWFRESFSWHPRISRIDTDGSLHEFWDPLFDYRNGQGSQGIPVGAFTANGDGLLVGPVENGPNGARIRRIDHEGDVSWQTATGCFVAGLSYACFASHRGDPRAELEPLHPNWITRGPRGDLWFTSDHDSLIGRLTEVQTLTIFTGGLSRWNSGPQFITTGPDGNMWFTEIRDRIGRITQDGRITEFSNGIPHRASLGGIVAGPDGNLWFTLYHGMVLGKITVNGRVKRLFQILSGLCRFGRQSSAT